MESGTAHAKLLHDLRRHCVGRPEIIQAPVDGDVMAAARRLEMLWPLLKAGLRCAMVRSILAVCLGTSFLLLAGTYHLTLGMSSTSLVLAFVGGLLPLILGLMGVPGGIPFLEVKTAAGFHFCDAGGKSARNVRIRNAFQAWQLGIRPCPYLRSGEFCTLLPFLWNPSRGGWMPYERIWLRASDGEHFATDWVFPPSGYDPDQPVVILLSGLAPSTHWTKAGGFLADAAWHLSCNAGMTVVVTVARGTMDTEVKQHLFHGARVTDLRDIVLLAEEVLGSVCQQGRSPSPLFAAGFSMGGIILANYCGVYGHDARILGAAQFSGVLDSVYNMKFEYSEKTWQAYLAHSLKTSFLTANVMAEAIRRGINIERVLSRHVSSIVDFDVAFTAPFNGYGGVVDYFKDMSLAAEDKWKRVAVPLLAVSAKDDPITHCDALHTNEFSAVNENLFFLITEHGGHVGWPLGWRPWTRGFDFMNEAIVVFVRAVLAQD